MHERIAKLSRDFYGQIGEGASSRNQPMIATCTSTTPRITAGQESARLVIEAYCTICGPMGDPVAEGISLVRAALAHSAATGHVVILNGTTDPPEADETLFLSS